MHTYFMETQRIGFSNWTAEDFLLANQLWGDREVTRWICATGAFTEQEIQNRLQLEIENEGSFHVQYWPVFVLKTGELLGCCGVRPYKTQPHQYEFGVHLCKKYWGQGYATEGAKAVISHGFTAVGAEMIFAGHHPQNTGSKKLLTNLGFQYKEDCFYAPTGQYHPSYELWNAKTL